jgi:hypothetical protein
MGKAERRKAEPTVQLIELVRGQKYRAKSRGNPGTVRKIEQSTLGGWRCDCEAWFYGNVCGHLRALQARADDEGWGPIRLAPAPYDKEREPSYDDWRVKQ